MNGTTMKIAVMGNGGLGGYLSGRLAHVGQVVTSKELQRWGEDPDAFAAEPWGEAVAWKM